LFYNRIKRILKLNVNILSLSLFNLLSSMSLSAFLLMQQHSLISIFNQPTQMGILLSIGFIPRIFLMPLGGLVADKYEKRILLLYVNYLRLATFCLLVIYFHLDNINLMMIYISTFIVGSLDAFQVPVVNAMLPRLVPKQGLYKANTLLSASSQLGLVSGPFISGFILDRYPLTMALILNVIAIAIACICIHCLPSVAIYAKQKKKGIIEGLSEGVAIIRQFSFGHQLVLLAVLNFIFNGVLIAITPLWVQQIFDYQASLVGVLNATFGFGVVLLSIRAIVSKNKVNAPLIVKACLLAIMICILSSINNLAAALLIYAIFGYLVSSINVTIVSDLQCRIPKENIGIAISITVFLAQAFLPISFLLISMCIQVGLSPSQVILIYGIVLLFILLVMQVAKYLKHR